MDKVRKIKTAIVIGAGGGIGSAIASSLNRSGVNVMLVGRKVDKLLKTAETFDNNNFHILPADASNMSKMIEVFKKTIRRFGELDILVLSVGSWGELMSLDIEPDKFSDQFDTHLNSIVKASIIPAFLAAKLFRDQKGGGKIFSVSSQVVSNKKLHGNLSYGVAKSAVSDALERIRFEDGVEKKIQICELEAQIVNTADNASRLKTKANKLAAVQTSDIGNWVAENVSTIHLPKIKKFRSNIVL